MTAALRLLRAFRYWIWPPPARLLDVIRELVRDLNEHEKRRL